MSAQQDLPLPSPAASNTVIINARCSLRIEAAQRVIVVAGLPVHHYCADDAAAEAYQRILVRPANGGRERLPERSAPCGGTRGAMQRVVAERRVSVDKD